MSGILSISPVVTDQQSNTASVLGVAATARARARSAGTKNIDAEDEATDAATMWDSQARGEGSGEDHQRRSRGQYASLDDEDDDEDGEAPKHRVNTYA